MAEAKPMIGLIGLGTMGSALALNIAEKGFPIAVFNRTVERTHAFHKEAGALQAMITPCETMADLVSSMAAPRAIILMVPAGEIVDKQIVALRPLLDKDDIIIDAGNANFHDTERRAKAASEYGERYIGMGVSGGEDGARHGPSIMGGGPKSAWQDVAPVMEAIAAKFQGEPCATWMGEGGAGHFVKTVHNGIEYADMQMIAEAYGIMRDGLGLSAQQIGEIFEKWNEGPLKSYLVEISGKVACAVDPETNLPVLNVILDKAGQKGTGRWTAIEALHLGTPVTAIDAAVAARNTSSRLLERKDGERIFGAAPQAMNSNEISEEMLEGALLAGKIACYAQGFAMLGVASKENDWHLPLPDVARVWRAGCIIRSSLLDDMAAALESSPDRNLMFAPFFADLLKRNHGVLRKVVGQAAMAGHPVPALSAGLSSFDMMRTGRSTANLIQGQRDFFGAHSFERVDKDGKHHGPW